MKIRNDCCFLCGSTLEAIAGHSIQRHPEVAFCRVALTDAYGVCLTDEETKIAETLLDDPQDQLDEPPRGMLDLHPPVDWVLRQLFDELSLPRLGGASTGKGWTSYSTAQRCFYLWKKRYVERVEPPLMGEPEGRAVGTIAHTFLALFYSNMIGAYRALTPQVCYDYLLERANPAYVNEGWRVFNAYRLYYKFDDLRPLAVEHDLRDPRTGESCRYDLIAFYAKPPPGGLLAGTYVFEHKTAGRFDWDTLEGWANDGEVIGEAALWRRLGLDKRFGPLRGVIVNLLGKQQEPKFHRTTIAPESFLVKSHLDDLRRWDGLLALCRATNNWPRSRANCLGRFGRCDWWDHCTTGAP